jgi:hypothetical protein
VSRELIENANEIIKHLEELALLANRTSCLAMELLCQIHTLAPNL